MVLVLDDGSVILVNLGMTGRLLLPGAREEPTHPGVTLELDDEVLLVYDDVRRFGVLETLTPEAWAERDGSLGIEPLSEAFTASALEKAAARSRSPVRSFLLDQGKVAGVGNIYANEALHRAGIHPCREARSLGEGEVRALHGALRTVLREAVEARGTTLQDYRDPTGDAGGFGARLRAYGRAGEACGRCGEPIQRIVFGNRPAFLCPSCQPAHR